MKCAKSGCLATLLWAGHKDDPSLASVAKESGWKIFEGIGWLCSHHTQAAIRALKGQP